ncbi:ROK family protein [Streptomyces sp. GC420]|uniref:ROK family transcriptional regulator n=1 Tax=Streptomyces sp. GC420 TaxID=2697568 RepID=UPI0014152C94|nr:ROK family protein [Streptomyces sp. GC420]NBM16780.1 ROK family protein [Streptomyces sp. GC420]
MNRTNQGSRSGSAGINLPALRSHNAALVLGLLRSAGEEGISRLELAERTGLTPQAVSKITARLRAEGLAAEAGRRASTGGKPRTLLRLVTHAGHAVGLHLDRDELTAVLVDLSGATVAVRHAPLDLGAGAEVVLGTAVREVGALLAAGLPGPRRHGSPQAAEAPGTSASPAPSEPSEPADGGPGGARPGDGRPGGAGARPVAPPRQHVLGVGVAMPGPLDHRTGVLHRVTGFPEWDGYPLRDALAARLGLPVVLDKDTNAAALGCALEEGDADSFAYLHLGTGLGAGLVFRGTVHRGARTGAGEFGHQVIQLDGPECSCGNHGCIEALCLAAVARGDTTGAARVLGEGAANLISLLDIDRVLLGGRVVTADEEAYVGGVQAALRARAQSDGIPVTVAEGGPRLVADGAAQLVLAPLFGRVDAVFPASRTD